jgi:hypothetical protein
MQPSPVSGQAWVWLQIAPELEPVTGPLVWQTVITAAHAWAMQSWQAWSPGLVHLEAQELVFAVSWQVSMA